MDLSPLHLLLCFCLAACAVCDHLVKRRPDTPPDLHLVPAVTIRQPETTTSRDWYRELSRDQSGHAHHHQSAHGHQRGFTRHHHDHETEDYEYETTLLFKSDDYEYYGWPTTTYAPMDESEVWTTTTTVIGEIVTKEDGIKNERFHNSSSKKIVQEWLILLSAVISIIIVL